ncbi:hypothetical protein LGT41_0000235 [Abyssibius alkaniclasticus]|uniref:hypothetical protein n=1 Tax=Abyssibius alkaniclasticus TaxID=2881234 RepID=UPI0023638CAD|nr:hypothetical protein [Abyssibius alkaniclasticus]UPH71277.1 hypothetical protein LGT41_0000235 [Abyssibius alkaniclasticus]|tara:strand:- start:1113 stop:1280 length:168 start_codon:yes stop_codon:yes gene_type:complete
MKKLATLLTLTATAASAHPGHGTLLGQNAEHAFGIGLVVAVIISAVVIARRHGRR